MNRIVLPAESHQAIRLKHRMKFYLLYQRLKSQHLFHDNNFELKIEIFLDPMYPISIR